METTVNERLAQFIESQGLNKNRLAIELGQSNGVIGNILNGKNCPSYDFLMRIKSRYPQLNMNWLIYNEGTMYLESEVPVEIYKDLTEALKRENTLLRDKIQSFDCILQENNKKTV